MDGDEGHWALPFPAELFAVSGLSLLLSLFFCYVSTGSPSSSSGSFQQNEAKTPEGGEEILGRSRD